MRTDPRRRYAAWCSHASGQRKTRSNSDKCFQETHSVFLCVRISGWSCLFVDASSDNFSFIFRYPAIYLRVCLQPTTCILCIFIWLCIFFVPFCRGLLLEFPLSRMFALIWSWAIIFGLKTELTGHFFRLAWYIYLLIFCFFFVLSLALIKNGTFTYSMTFHRTKQMLSSTMTEMVWKLCITFEFGLSISKNASCP